MRPTAKRHGAPAGQRAHYWPLAAFALLYLGLTLAWNLPWQAGAVYAGASAASVLAYARDKAAARAGRRRTPERDLLLLGLAGGWPGAILAQQWLRHKSSKTTFRLKFWATAAVNSAALVWLAGLQAGVWAAWSA